MSHSPGPWKLTEAEHRCCWDYKIEDAARIGVADVSGDNANLLLAAPDLLEACKAALASIDNDWYGLEPSDFVREIKLLRAAIQKAETNET